jgi:tRNA 2-thiouridine synthesizing protein E
MSSEELQEEQLDNDGFLKEMSNWNREMAEELAERNELGPLTEEHWKIIDYVRDYFKQHGEGPAVVKIGKALDMPPSKICDLFPCGVARGAYRLAGLPRPFGCV